MKLRKKQNAEKEIQKFKSDSFDKVGSISEEIVQILIKRYFWRRC